MTYQVAYLDTSYLQAILSQGEEREVAEKTLYKLKSNHFNIRVPLIAVGEFVNNLWRKWKGAKEEGKTQETLTRYLFNSIQCLFNSLQKYEADLSPPPKEVCKHVGRLMQKEEKLSPSDALAIAQAIADASATWFFTSDRLLLISPGIKEYIREVRGSGSTLNIRESLKG